MRTLRVAPGEPARLGRRDTDWFPGPDGMSKSERKAAARDFLGSYVEELSALQEVLYASDRYAVLVVFQAMDAAGKDGTIKHVLTGVNPQGCEVTSFKAPSSQELAHTFLWRCMTALPQRGRIGIFNRSYYEEMLVTRVHPELLEKQRLPYGPERPSFWDDRFEDVNAFERHLDRNGTKVVKFFLHVSKAEQRKRFLARLDDPDKHWKFNSADLAERGRWHDYMDAYEKLITATSTPWAPWYVVPADHKPTMRAMVAGILVSTLDALDLSWPDVDPEEQADLDAARKALEAE
ncbi:MAG: polyphosphate kinase 2 family protein [Acidimicrobiia bacterium]|nr:polyphosphate kinase 2 family protein [Acidimicrobiia bacterium]